MAADGQLTIEQLFSQLQAFGRKGDFAKGFKIASQILKRSPNDRVAFQCKVVCLVQQSKFKEALHLMNGHVTLSEELHLEKAYCHYRLNNLLEAKRILESVHSRTPSHNELLGQVLYRLEEYSSSLALYTDLMRHSQDEYGDEREANMAAVLVGQLSQSPDTWDEQLASQLRTDTYELFYNNACMLLHKGQAAAAEAMLKKAEDLCRQSLQEDPDVLEEDIEDELGIIRVQRAYALQVQGKVDAAGKLYAHVLKLKPDDISLAAVASNNIISINKDRDLFDSAKKAKALVVDGLDHKLTKLQKQCMLLNRCLLLLYTNQIDQLRGLIGKMKPSSDLPCLLHAAQKYRDRRIQDAIRLLQDRVVQHPDSSLTAQLTLAQIHLSQGHIEEACGVLQSLSTLQHFPGMVSSLTALYQRVDRTAKAKEVLDAAVAVWRQRKVQDESAKCLPELLQQYASFLMRHCSPEEAASVLEDLRQEKPSDIYVLAQLINAYSQFDARRAEQLSLSLPALDTGDSVVDVDAMEDAPSGFRYARRAVVTAASKHPSAQSAQSSPAVKEKERKKKKKKKGKLPKNYNPEVDPDPERWLPVRERSYARKKYKKTAGAVGKGTQGAAPDSPHASTEGLGRAEASRVSSSPSASSPKPQQQHHQQQQVQQPAGKAAQQAKKKQQGKKKKGKGW